VARNDPLYVTWFTRIGGRLKEVDIFEFISSTLNKSTFEWNTVGMGNIIFKRGTLKILSFEESKAGKGKGNNYEALWFELDLKKVQEGTNKTEDFLAGITILNRILGDKNELIKLEKKAYAYMVDLLTQYLGDMGALSIANEVKSNYKPPKTLKSSGKIVPQKEFLNRFKTAGTYSSKWEQLVNQIILKKDPKVVGGAVVSFSLADLLKIQLPSERSSLKSIFMMEEFGTGLYADKELRRPYLGAATPFKVPTAIAKQWGMPDAIYMWWPFFNFVQKAFFMKFNKLKGRTGITWLNNLKTAHTNAITSLNGELVKVGRIKINDYRKKAFASIKKYKEQESLSNPLEWAYGGKRGGIGHPGREARHLFFNKGGIVNEIRIIQQAGYRYLLQLIDAEIAKVVGKGRVASLASTVFGIHTPGTF